MGGYALKDHNISPISLEDVPTAIKTFSELSTIPIQFLHKIGSTGKNEISSDIDLAVDSNLYPPEKYHALLSMLLGTRAIFNPGTGVGSYAIEVFDGVRYQFDLMFTSDVKWAKFAYWSPNPGNSQYKGAVRTLLLMGVAAQINQHGVDQFIYNDDGLLMVRAGRTFDLNNGIRRIFQYRPKKKRGDGYLKNMKTTTLEELKEMFDQVNVTNDEVLITDPDAALEIMFQTVIHPRDVETAEQVLDLIYSKFHPPVIENIFTKTADRARSVKDKFQLPTEITSRF